MMFVASANTLLVNVARVPLASALTPPALRAMMAMIATGTAFFVHPTFGSCDLPCRNATKPAEANESPRPRCGQIVTDVRRSERSEAAGRDRPG